MEVLNEVKSVEAPKPTRSIGNRIKRAFFGWFFVLFLLGITAWILAGTVLISDSKFRSGNVIKFGKDGLILKTHEGTLRMGGGENMMNTDRSEFEFSVTNDEMIAQLEKVDSRKTVKLWYDKTWVALPWRGNTKYYIRKMEVMPDIYPVIPQTNTIQQQIQQPTIQQQQTQQVPQQQPVPQQ